MRYRKGILILALAVFLLSIAGAWAGNTNDTATGDNSPLELSEDDMISIDENEDMLSENEKTFGDLNTTINGNGDSDIYLDCDYRYTENDSAFNEGIVINRDLNVYGNGHVINGSNEARIFNIISGKVMFHNITFTNGNIGKWTDGGALYGECTAVNCTFIRNAAYHGGAMAGGSARKALAARTPRRYRPTWATGRGRPGRFRPAFCASRFFPAGPRECPGASPPIPFPPAPGSGPPGRCGGSPPAR